MNHPELPRSVHGLGFLISHLDAPRKLYLRNCHLEHYKGENHQESVDKSPIPIMLNLFYIYIRSSHQDSRSSSLSFL